MIEILEIKPAENIIDYSSAIKEKLGDDEGSKDKKPFELPNPDIRSIKRVQARVRGR